MLNNLQSNLFEESVANISAINGLTYIPNFISPAEETALLDKIDSQPWLLDLKRRVQHYGYKYDYKARNVTSDLRLGDLPEWISTYSKQLFDKQIFPKIPDQVIINEYQPGQGIASHIDCIPCFEETIALLSLGSPCIMEFTHSKNNQKIPVLLESRSLVALQDDARYIWKHGIANRKTDKHKGVVFNRGRRVSCTFRNVTP